jgi:hypothetical protein
MGSPGVDGLPDFLKFLLEILLWLVGIQSKNGPDQDRQDKDTGSCRHGFHLALLCVC